MIDVIWLLLRAAGLMLTLQGAGAALFEALFAAHLGAAAGSIARLGRQLTLAALGVLLLQLGCEPAHLAGEWSGLVQPDLWRLLLRDSAAYAFLLRAAGLAAIALSIGRAPRAAAAACLLVAASFLLTGHTRTHAPAAGLGSALAVHLAAVLYWFGSLWPLLQLLKREPRARAIQAVAAFSRLAVVAVPLLALAGVVLALALLPDLRALRLPYGRLLLLKIGLFGVALALAAHNRLRLAPALARGEPRAAAALGRSILVEYLLLGAVLAVTAVMSGAFAPEGD
jgi:putative copper export protein